MVRSRKEVALSTLLGTW